MCAGRCGRPGLIKPPWMGWLLERSIVVEVDQFGSSHLVMGGYWNMGAAIKLTETYQAIP